MRAIFVRHGESTGNAGSPCHDLAKLELTEKGKEQARPISCRPVQPASSRNGKNRTRVLQAQTGGIERQRSATEWLLLSNPRECKITAIRAQPHKICCAQHPGYRDRRPFQHRPRSIRYRTILKAAA